MTQHKQPHGIKWHDHHIKWHDMTCHVATNHSSSPHVTSQPPTLLHLTPQAISWFQNRSHHHHGTAEGSFTAKKWFGHRADRSSCAHSISKFFLSYTYIYIYYIYIVLVLFSSETSAPARPGTTCNFIYTWIEWWKCVEQRQIEKTFRIPQKVLSVEENHFVTSNRQVGLRVSSMLVPSWCMKSNGYDAAGTWPTLLRVFRTQGQPTSFTAHLTSTSLKAWRNMAKRTCTNLNHGECDQSLWPRN